MAIEVKAKDAPDLIFSFADDPEIEEFDGPGHGMDHMQRSVKRVDLIVRWDGDTWLLEIKDPENRTIPPKHARANLEEFREKRQSGRLFEEELAPKLRDTLAYLCLAHRSPRTNIRYVAFIGLDELDTAMLLRDQERLQALCYLPGPHRKPWPSNFNVVVVNIAEWNKRLAPHSVRRTP